MKLNSSLNYTCLLLNFTYKINLYTSFFALLFACINMGCLMVFDSLQPLNNHVQGAWLKFVVIVPSGSLNSWARACLEH